MSLQPGNVVPETATSAAGLLIDGTRALFGGTRNQGLRAGTSRFLSREWFVGWKVMMSIYCIVWAAYLDRNDMIELRIYLATWTHLIATAYFVISTISALLCMAYIARETPAPVEEGKPKPPPPAKSTRSPVPCYFRWIQHITWVIACLSSMITMAVFWMAIYDGVDAPNMYVSVTLLAILLVVDQFLIASEFKWGFAWQGLYFFVIYIFFNVIYYYETTGDDRVTFEVFDWEENPGKAVLWIFLILAIFLPLVAGIHYFFYRLRERMFREWKHKLEPVAETPPPAEEEKEKPKEPKKPKKKDKKEDPPPPPPPPLAVVAPAPVGPYYFPPGFVPPPGAMPYPPPQAVAPAPAPPAAPKKKMREKVMDALNDVL